jgi:uncharacterized protein
MIEDLLEAVRKGDLEQVKAVAGRMRSLDERNERGESAVLLAAYYRKRDVLEFLLARHPRLNIHEASAAGDLARVRELIENDSALLDSHAPDGHVPLGLAAFFSHPEIVDYLLSRGAQVNQRARNATSVMPLHAAVAGRNAGIVASLLESGADPNARQQGGYTPLHAAAQNGDEEILRLLLSRGADVEALTDDGKTAAMLAAAAGRERAAGLLRPARET